MNKDITEQHYKTALKRIAYHFSEIAEEERPVTIFQNGSIGTIGVSDIDLIFVFPDSFDQGNNFSQVYEEAISHIPYKEVFFIHDPMLLSESSARYLPTYTLNPAKDLNKIFGKKIIFETEEPNEIQSILISLEFIQFRLFQLVNILQSNNMSQQGILLRGHSMKHSITLAVNAGINLSDIKFSAFNIVQDIRNSINNGKSIQLSKKEVDSLAKGIISEFNLLYRKFVSEAEKHVSFYLPSEDSYSYNVNVDMAELFNKGKNLHQEVRNSTLKVYGMHWINKLIKDLYFGTGDTTAIIADDQFKEACLSRATFHKHQWVWNKKVFGSIHAGLSPMPSVIGKQAERYAQMYWGI